MSEWDFLHEMSSEGYSGDEIQHAMATGATPEEWDIVERQERKAEWEKLKQLRDTNAISREEFKKRKKELFE